MDEELFRRINDFIYDEKMRQKKLEDPSLRVLEPEMGSLKLSRNVGEPFGMNLASVLCVRDTLSNGIAAQNYVKNDDIIVQLNGYSTINMSERWAIAEISKSARLVLTIDRQNELAPVNVELSRRGGQGFGFSLGNRIFIDAIKEDSIADRYLDVFDIILQIDELDCTNQPLNIVKHRIANDQNRTIIITTEKGFQGPPTSFRGGSPTNYLIPNTSFNTTLR